MARYGLTAETSGGYLVARLIPPNLGGTNDKSNLLPIRKTGQANIKQKQAVDAWLFTQVCTQRTTLTAARHTLASNWWVAYQAMRKGQARPARRG